MFAVRLKRNETIETIDGMLKTNPKMKYGSIMHCSTFLDRGKYPGPDPVNSLHFPEKDVDGQRLHDIG
ncbi:MAG: hypothetical protein CM1200mP25_4240 [Acidobacteriota bacterium]|nr:MAG: hypothetical protein CM1200mP25_4240 [Acidobacteriota bacterium]